MSLQEPSLRNLAYLLRHPELWPAGFEFDFSHSETCAMGLAAQVWDRSIIDPHYGVCTRYLAPLLGIDPDLASDLFITAPFVSSDELPTAADVADAIDRVLGEP